MAFASADELQARLAGLARVEGDRLEVTDAGRFRDELVDELAFEAVFNADDALRDAGAVVFEIAKSEMAYTEQRPAEYTAVILAAAIREGWRTPVFLQGDHFQFNAPKWAADPTTEMEGIKDLTREAIAAGFLNIDVDSSTLVDLSLPTVHEQQRVNA